MRVWLVAPRRGSLGTTVQRATDTRSGEQVVLKTYNKRSPQAMVAYHREVAAFRAVKHHEYVVRLLDVIEDHHQVSLVFPLYVRAPLSPNAAEVALSLLLAAGCRAGCGFFRSHSI